MRFDLLDEYSTLVPFGFGVSNRNRVVQYPNATTNAVKRSPVANFASHLEMLRKRFGALRQTVLSGYRSLIAKY